MSAKEMFENLGFYLDIETNETQVVWSKNKYNRYTFALIGADCITFDRKEKEIFLDGIEDISFELLQAINKQVEELGWLNDRDK